MGLAVETLCGFGPSSSADRSRGISPRGGSEPFDTAGGWEGGNRMMRPSDASRPGTSGTSIARRSREGEGEDGGYLTLKVVRPSQEEGEGIEIHFRVKQTTQVKSVFFMKKRKKPFPHRWGS